MTGPLLVTAWLSSPLAGDPPQLDALLEWCLSPFSEEFRRAQDQGVPHYQIDRIRPAPRPGEIRIPIGRVWLGNHLVSQCSDPILPRSLESVDYINKRIAVEDAGLLAEPERRVITVTNSWTKSYRLPLRIRPVDRVRWFAVGNRRNLRKALRDAASIGKKVADGYGRVREWIVEDIKEDWTWFAPSEQGLVLMRTLPLLIDVREWLPNGLQGWRRGYGACSSPYWHPDRFCDLAIPC